MWYNISVVSVIFIPPHLLEFNNDAILSMIPLMKTVWTSSKSSRDVVLLVNLMMLQLLKVPNTGQYVKSKLGWYSGCLTQDTPGA